MTENTSQIELLYFDDCPSWKNTLEILNTTLSNIGHSADVSIIQVETHEEAQKYKFVGSPTIRVNGVDLFPVDQEQYALGCRVYQTPNGFRGWPTEDMLEKQLTAITA